MTSHDPQSHFERMDFAYTLTPDEMKRLALPVPSDKPKWRSWGMVIFFAVMVSVFTGIAILAWDNPLGLIPAIVVYSWGFQLLWAIAARIVLRLKPPAVSATEIRVAIDREGVVEERPERIIVVTWSQIENVRIVHGFLRFGRLGRPAIVVPLRCLPEGTDPQGLLQSILRTKAQEMGSERPPGMASLSGPAITYTSGQNEVTRLYRHFLRHEGRAARRQQWVVLALYFLGSMLLSFHFLESLGRIGGLTYWLTASIVLTLATSPVALARKGSIAILKQAPGVLGTVTIAMSPEKIEVVHKGGVSLTTWSGVLGVERDKTTIYMRFIENTLITIPRTAFAASSEEAAFYETAMRYWTAARTGSQAAGQDEAVWPPAPRKV